MLRAFIRDFGTRGLPGTFKIFLVDVIVQMARSELVLTLPLRAGGLCRRQRPDRARGGPCQFGSRRVPRVVGQGLWRHVEGLKGAPRREVAIHDWFLVELHRLDPLLRRAQTGQIH